MTDYWTLHSGFVTMVVSILVGILMASYGGLILDTMVNTFHEMGFNAGEGTEWDTTNELNFWINLYYIVCLMIPLLGIAVFILASTHRVRYDQTRREFISTNADPRHFYDENVQDEY